jgi:tetratricopeptide (TPR) repeat protein
VAAEHDVTVQIGDVYQAAAPLAAALHQLPPPPGDFTGRKAELAELMQAIEKGGITVSGLRGMGGIGKTALALKLAERLRERYPEAQIYLDLKGTSEKPLTTAEAMAHVVRSYRPTDKPPEDEAQLAGLYHSVLDGQRALLLMDNAANSAQVAPLIPPATCILLATSRQHFALPGLYPKNLEALPPEDARSLLLAIAPRIDDAADAIAELCGYLPLALRAAGGMVAASEDLSPHRYAEQLSDERQRSERLGKEGVEISVEASFNLSYANLDAPAARVFRQLAVFPGSFNGVAEEFVCQDPEHACLSELLGRSLVEYDSAAERYRLHDLTRLFAAARWSDQERAEAEWRHAAHYLEVASAANGLYLKGGDAILKGLSLFDTEWPNIRAGQARAAAHAEQDAGAASLCNEYPARAGYCGVLRLHPQERIRWVEAALASARRLKDRPREGMHLVALGSCYSALGQPRLSLQHDRQALVIAREVGNRRGEATILGNFGVAYWCLGDRRRAIDQFHLSLTIQREVEDKRGEALTLGNLGIAYGDLGELRVAVGYFEQALAVCREIGDRRGEGSTLGDLGIAYRQLGEAGRAIECLKQGLAIAREIGDRRDEGKCLGGLGIAYRRLGELGCAIEHFQGGLAIARETGDRRGEAIDLFNMSMALNQLGDRAQAIANAQAALNIFVEIEDPNADVVRRQLAEWGAENHKW